MATRITYDTSMILESISRRFANSMLSLFQVPVSLYIMITIDPLATFMCLVIVPIVMLPIILVGGMRSKQVMEEVLASGDADFVALCRPLICEPDFPNKMKTGEQQVSSCISAINCYPLELGEGIACKCPMPKR